jgi:hypothetical protein
MQIEQHGCQIGVELDAKDEYERIWGLNLTDSVLYTKRDRQNIVGKI